MTELYDLGATVTYALYDEAPIACQGDDDRKKIQVVTERIAAGRDIHAEALKRSLALSKSCGTFAQVWDIQADPKNRPRQK